MEFLLKIWARIALQPNLCHTCWRMIKTRIELTWVKNFWTELMVIINFWKTLLQEMIHGYTSTMSKRKSNHHSGCQKFRRENKARQVRSHVKVMLTVFLILSVLFTTSFYRKAGHSIRSIIWKICNVFVRQSGKKTWCMAGELMDVPIWQSVLTFIFPCPWRLGQKRDDCPSTASVLSRSRTSWLPSVSQTQIKAEGRHFESTETIKTNSLAHLSSIPKTAFQQCFRTL